MEDIIEMLDLFYAIKRLYFKIKRRRGELSGS